MQATLVPGIVHEVSLTVPDRFTVPGLMPDVPSWAAMPPVLATSLLVAIMEWAALEAILPHLDADEQSLGILVDMTHTAPTPPGMLVRAEATVVAVDGRFVDFTVAAFDAHEPIGSARHRRAVIKRPRFDERIAKKRGN
jgi:fluoroacetyl-CoA thioesterase